VVTAKRIAVAPETPTLIESGVTGFDVTSWFGLFVPAKTPPKIVAKIHDDVVAALNADKVKPKLLGLGCEIIGSTPEQLATHMKSEMDRWGPAITRAGIRVDD
jgi:tripartite-type tricarboxylate transporter receptor subunit TctC